MQETKFDMLINNNCLPKNIVLHTKIRKSVKILYCQWPKLIYVLTKTCKLLPFNRFPSMVIE